MDRNQVQQTSATNSESTTSIHLLDSKQIKDNTSNGTDTPSYNTDSDEGSGIKFKDWGFQVDRLFEVAYRFYKRNESKAFHPSFDERNQLIALILQARYGNFDGIKAPDVGTLDLVGKSRRQQWATLKGMSKTEAMSKFISTLDELCPFFKAHVEAVKISCGTDSFVDKLTTAGQQILNEHSSNSREDTNSRAIYTSLCRQTYEQFKGYAMKQYPNDVQQQKYLIASLQEQYYQQYISQMHPDLSNSSPKDSLKISLSPAASETSSLLHESTDNLPTNHERASSSANSASQGDVAQPIKKSSTQVSPAGNSENIPSLLPELKAEQNSELAAGSNHPPSNQVASSTSNNRHYNSLSEANPVSEREVNLEPNVPKPIPYQPTDLQSIGKFESFPEPRPIPSKAHPLSITTTKTQAIATNGNKGESQQPAYTTIDLSGQPIAREDSFSLLPAPPQQELPPPPEQVSRPPFEHNLTPSAQQELLPPPQFSHESALFTQSCDLKLARDHRAPSSSNSDCQIALSQTNEPTVALENKPPVELWGCDGISSSGSDSVQDDSPLEQGDTSKSLESASTWTKRGVNDFKDSLVDDKHGGVYIVKQGTLVTIQVPTYPDGRYIYWEFATEDYDIGFGLDFIYEANLMQPLAIKIFEETDEDEDDDDCDEIERKILNQMSDETETPIIVNRVLNSIEQKRAEKFAMIANTVSIIPTYRRDSHEEIFVGRHRYPGNGYYLLKFDNTYSVLRSKSLYFRICYFI